MTLSLAPNQRNHVYRSVVVLCVVLTFLIGFIAATHFHPQGSADIDRSCSICALAHSGVVEVELGPQVPILNRSELAETSVETSYPLLLISEHFIRPPPAV